MPVLTLLFACAPPTRLRLTRWPLLLWGLGLLLTTSASGQFHGDQFRGLTTYPDHRLSVRATFPQSPHERLTSSISPAPARASVTPPVQPASQARSTPAFTVAPASTDTDYAAEPDVFVRDQRMQRPTSALLNETYRQADANWSQHLAAWKTICLRSSRHQP